MESHQVSTTVSNVKVSQIRPKYKDLRAWCDDTKNVYIGRAGVVFVDKERFPKKSSLWANPFKVGRDGTLETILQKFEVYIRELIAGDSMKYDLNELRGHNLGCWCVPSTVSITSNVSCVCHGQVLLKLIDESKEGYGTVAVCSDIVDAKVLEVKYEVDSPQHKRESKKARLN